MASESQHLNQFPQWLLQESRQPIALAAAKSRAGHGETGAGVLGIVAVVAQLRSSAASPLLHLRSVNPHVASLLGRDPGSKRLSAAVARTAAPAVDAVSTGNGDAAWHSGVSSFAFQVRHLN